MSFDLSTLDTKKAAEDGAIINLENPFTKQPLVDDEKKSYYIKILGADSGKISDRLRDIADRRLEYIQRTRKIMTESEIARQEDIETLAAATLDWYLPAIDGETWDCSEVNAAKLYSDKRFPWLREQLEKVIGDRSRFFKKNSLV